MPPLTVVGFDPSLTALGIATVHSGEPGHFVVTQRGTIRTDVSMSLQARLFRLGEMVTIYLAEEKYHAVAIEDVTTQVRTKTKKNNPRTIAVMAAAFGVVVQAVHHQVSDPVLYDVDQWMPKEKTGHFEHIMKKERMVKWLMSRIEFPLGGPTEHELMAAGVARRHIEVLRLDLQRQAAGIRL